MDFIKNITMWIFTLCCDEFFWTVVPLELKRKIILKIGKKVGSYIVLRKHFHLFKHFPRKITLYCHVSCQKYEEMRWDEMRWDEMRWDEMRCDAMRCDVMRCDAMRCDAMRCDAMRCDAMRYQLNTCENQWFEIV